MLSIQPIFPSWRRRWWRPDAEALQAFAGLRPLAVVTGGSEGIGLAFARALVRAGAEILLVARDQARLAEAATAIAHEFPGSAIATLALDLTTPDALATFDRTLAGMRAYADILVNNAGIGLGGPFVGQAPADIDALLALNVAALTRLCRHVLPGQLVRGRGGIINLASIGGYCPAPQQAVYYASKAYVLSFSEALAAETAGRGIHVLAVAPGPVSTRFHAKIGAEHALYRYLLPAQSAECVVRAAIIGFRLGLRVVVPGLFNPVLVLALRLLPHRLMLPLMAILMRTTPLAMSAANKHHDPSSQSR